MIRFNSGDGIAQQQAAQSRRQDPPLYTREAFRALLARQPEWKIRAALEEGNIPCSNIEHALEWLDEMEQGSAAGCAPLPWH